ncbi:hypothetical protein CDL15_Pgr021438 [Punica granatum]|uniref:Uncharacterized protein n=1 Tax=Punica granatum TaxID=22663 RepID=A0A218W738_PUNGR|nr:hypothetical protein CDL15_Pgr021438 [Punica granatum]
MVTHHLFTRKRSFRSIKVPPIFWYLNWRRLRLVSFAFARVDMFICGPYGHAPSKVCKSAPAKIEGLTDREPMVAFRNGTTESELASSLIITPAKDIGELT